MRGSALFIPYIKIQKFVYILLSIMILSIPASRFLEMIMLISLEGMLTQTRIEAGSIMFYRRGSMKGQPMSSLCKNP